MNRNTPPKNISWTKFLDVLTETEGNNNKNKRIIVERATETERLALSLLRREGWSAKVVKDKQPAFEIELQHGNRRIAVKLRNQRAKVQLAQIEKFAEFLNDQSARFTKGYFISTSGFTPSVYSFFREEQIENIGLAIMREDRLIWDAEKFETPDEKDETIYIGVFTCKGGVGKTTISAHLAGAFALNGYDVALIDLDRQQNLRKLLGKSVRFSQAKREGGSKISVLSREEWKGASFEKPRIVVCDCNPEFDANPVEFIRKFDHCIVPTTLNPLGINKNADVIKRTFEAIRRENARANLFVLINNLYTDEERRNTLLNEKLKSQFEEVIKRDEFCHYIAPHNVAIRFSKQLLYWGLHIFDETEPQLAFRSIGGYSYPRTDFLKLVDYLELHTKISKAKALLAKAA